MSAPKPARTPEKAARLVALMDGDPPGYLGILRARAAAWLLVQIDNGNVNYSYRHDGMSDADLRGWCRSICAEALKATLADVEREIVSASQPIYPPAGVVPIRRAKGKPA